jgi:hypothetical protein
MAHGIAHQFAGDEPPVIERPPSVVDLGQCIPDERRRVFIAGKLEGEQISGS